MMSMGHVCSGEGGGGKGKATPRRWGDILPPGRSPFDQLPWQNIGILGTDGTIAEDPVEDAPEV